ncbi:exocyst complex component 6B isoform X1 [Neocloeon triangulifer]|uniref:exocyst complex component 6B isoform X1 n=1 Tax=Neocloeon triangulifer TaxID=2078957 RepID=UPI00286F7864|nr:exocyst complex component 6B isoform X1 [Neocloeon triangulifer]
MSDRITESASLYSIASDSRYEHLLYELETNDTSSVGLVIRAIYDGDEHKSFMEKLDARIKTHDKDIEKMCNFHYQGFIDSIRELLQVRTQAQKLNEGVVGINTEIRSSAAALAAKGEELCKARKTEHNIATAIESLSLCLPVLTTYAKLQKQMAEKRYYPALKTLEMLEHQYLPRVANYRFSQQMRENIPILRENIKDASMSELKDFLENIRKLSPKIGEVAMKHTNELLASDPVAVVRKKKRQAPAPPNPFTGEVEQNFKNVSLDASLDGDDDLSAQDMIDFSPVYRCLHIYTVLGLRDLFEDYYRKQRKKQALLVIQPPTNMHESVAEYKTYIHAIVGFFVIEDHILNTGNGLVTRSYLDEVWSMALTSIVNALRTHTAYCTDATLMLKIKYLIMIFNNTLRNYGYSVVQLTELLAEIREHYNEVLMQRWVQVFREILDEESFLPIEVQTSDEFDDIVNNFPFVDDGLQQKPFPKLFPFSSMVPKVYQQVKEFIYACLKFSDDLNLSHEEVCEMIRKSTNLLLTRTFSGCLSSSFRKPSLGLLQMVQIILDTGYLEQATVYLEEFVANITGAHVEAQFVSRNGPPAMFRVARADAEQQIIEKLQKKLDEFMELENYDWMLGEPQGHASSHIADMIAYLQSTLQAFNQLPVAVAQKTCKAACQHLADGMLHLLLQEEVRQVSLGALSQLNLDIIQCEQFAASEPVPGIEEDACLQYFAEMRQLLDLVMTWDWPTYFHDYGQETSKYPNVNPNNAIILLEKMREADKKTVFAVLKKSERDKKKLLETVLKQLRQLASAPIQP